MQYSSHGMMIMWVQGDQVSRGIALTLLLMSIASWYVLLTRTWRLMRLRRRARAAADFWQAHSFDAGMQLLAGSHQDNPFRHLAEEGRNAVDHHRSKQADLQGQLSLSDWLTRCLRGAIDESAERLQGGLPLLASVAATAPFVGLFGTVWGIYHALISIGASAQASIDRVAGPVGEALIMTAFGLAVAIPAVLGFNALTRGNKAILGRLSHFAHNLHAYFVTGSPVVRRRQAPQQAPVVARDGG